MGVPPEKGVMLRFRLLYCADRLSLGLSTFLSSYTPPLRTDYDSAIIYRDSLLVLLLVVPVACDSD
jgi:hypothetical protein